MTGGAGYRPFAKGIGTKVSANTAIASQPIAADSPPTRRVGSITDGWAQPPPPTSSANATHTYQFAGVLRENQQHDEREQAGARLPPPEQRVDHVSAVELA